MSTIKLTHILNEIKSQQRKAIIATRRRTLSILTLEAIIESGALPINQTTALKEFFNYYNRHALPLLNENTIRRIDSQMISEGFLDWIKDKGAAVANALKAGWDSVKKIWGNFKDFITSLIKKIKETFKAAVDLIKTKIESAINWIADLGKAVATLIKTQVNDTEKQKNLAAEIKDLTACISHIATWKNEKIIDGGDWSQKLLDGSAISAAGDVDDIKTENSIFKDKALITLFKEGDEAKPEDMLKKFPTLYKIVEYLIEGLKWFFDPVGTALKTVIKLGVKSVFKATSLVSKALKGPGIYEFAVLTYLITEGGKSLGKKIEYIHDAIEATTDAIVTLSIDAWSWMTGPGKPIIDIFKSILNGIIMFLGYYSTAKLILNIIKPVIDQANTGVNLQLK